jgi:phage gpG-like protein
MATRVERSRRLIEFIGRLDAQIDAAMDLAGEVVATQARKNVQQSGRGGRTYQKYSPRRTHKASKAGESPATDQGNLARSISSYSDNQNKIIYVYCSAQIAPYARALEYGDMSGNLAPRPFLRPALLAKRDNVMRIMAGAVNRAMRDSQ